MGCGTSKSTRTKQKINVPLENDGTVIQDLEFDENKGGYLHNRGVRNGIPTGQLQRIPRDASNAGGSADTPRGDSRLPPIKLAPIVQAGAHISSGDKPVLTSDNNGAKPTAQGNLLTNTDVKKPIAFDLTLDGKNADQNNTSIVKKHPPKRFQRLEPLPGLTLTAERLAEKIREAEVRKEQELQKRARSAQQSDRRRQRLLRNKERNSADLQNGENFDQSTAGPELLGDSWGMSSGRPSPLVQHSPLRAADNRIGLTRNARQPNAPGPAATADDFFD